MSLHPPRPAEQPTAQEITDQVLAQMRKRARPTDVRRPAVHSFCERCDQSIYQGIHDGDLWFHMSSGRTVCSA